LEAFSVSPAIAKETVLGTFGTWRAYRANEGGQTVCYMVTTKLIKTTGPKKRALPYLMITHRPIEASTDVFSYGAGLKMNPRHGAKLTIGRLSFELFSVGDTAWARDSLTDHQVARAIRNAPSLQVRIQPDKKGGVPVTDQFELSGSPTAYHAINKACGLPDGTQKKTAQTPRRSSRH
jgi:hypothetical protein